MINSVINNKSHIANL